MKNTRKSSKNHKRERIAELTEQVQKIESTNQEMQSITESIIRLVNIAPKCIDKDIQIKRLEQQIHGQIQQSVKFLSEITELRSSSS